MILFNQFPNTFRFFRLEFKVLIKSFYEVWYFNLLERYLVNSRRFWEMFSQGPLRTSLCVHTNIENEGSKNIQSLIITPIHTWNINRITQISWKLNIFTLDITTPIKPLTKQIHGASQTWIEYTLKNYNQWNYLFIARWFDINHN